MKRILPSCFAAVAGLTLLFVGPLRAADTFRIAQARPAGTSGIGPVRPAGKTVRQPTGAVLNPPPYQSRPAGYPAGAAVQSTATPPAAQAQSAVNPAGEQGQITESAAGQIRPAGNAIGPGDILQITVYQQPDLSQEVRVGEHGNILLPLIGQVTAGGQTGEALSRVLTARYAEFLVNPQVTVFVKEYHRREITVAILGEVRGPGRYRVPEHTTILDLISQVGGLAEGSGGRVIVLRSVSSAETRDADAIIVNAQELFTPAGMKTQNIELIDGDTVHVPRADHYYVFGEVARPGAYKLEKDAAIDVFKAIGLAGGFTDKASRGGLKITREIGGKKAVFKPTMETELRSQDIIVVPESFF